VGGELWEHQKIAVERYLKENEIALLWDCGTGKTRAVIELLRYKYREAGLLRKTLILCPAVVVQNWADEIDEYSNIASNFVLPLSGPIRKRSTVIDETSNAIIITNYEGLTYKVLKDSLAQWGPEIIVFDESHRLKNPRARRSKVAYELACKTDIRFILTGTPVLKSPMDIFHQWKVLDLGRTFGRNFFSFRTEYFYDLNAAMNRQNYFPKWVPRPESHELINREIYKKAMRAKKEECLDLPPLIKKKIYCELTREQAVTYKSLKDDFLAWLDHEGVVSADLAIVRMLRLMQLVSGHVALDDGSIRKIPATPRLRVLSELLEDLTPGNKVIVWCVFRQNYKDVAEVCKKLGVRYVELHGEVSQRDRACNINLFNQTEDVRVLIGHPGSGGIGVNLISASCMVYYSRNHNVEFDIQSEARNYRGGSERHEKIVRYDIVAKGTLDEAIIQCLEGNISDAAKIVETIREGV
jgi:SNF2 family DNA or RNA helicase